MKRISLKPIGWVRNNESGERKHAKWKDLKSEIILAPELEEALDGIDEYSHIVVVFWMNQVKKSDRSLKKIVPYGLHEVGEKGVFATHMPERPNPIGVSIVELVSRDKNVFVVQGLDAFNDTPVLDIKPYTGHPRDLVDNFKVPEWDKRN